MNFFITLKNIIVHKIKVIIWSLWFSFKLIIRVLKHDNSKLSKNEFPYYEYKANEQKNVIFGSDKYMELREYQKPARENHYKYNPHHLEYHNKKIERMTLFDLIEMVIDWKSASTNNKDGNILKSINYCCNLYNIPFEIRNIFINTFIDNRLNLLLNEISLLDKNINLNINNYFDFSLIKLNYNIVKNNILKRIINNNKKIVNNINRKLFYKVSTIEDIKKSKNIIGIFSGCFDGLHSEHLEKFKWIKDNYQNIKLCVITYSDKHIRNKKGVNRPYFNINDRLLLLQSLRDVDYILYTKDNDCVNILNELKPTYMFMNKMNINKNNINNEIDTINSNNGNVIFFPHDTIISTTNNFVDFYRNVTVFNGGHSW